MSPIPNHRLCILNYRCPFPFTVLQGKELGLCYLLEISLYASSLLVLTGFCSVWLPSRHWENFICPSLFICLRIFCMHSQKHTYSVWLHQVFRMTPGAWLKPQFPMVSHWAKNQIMYTHANLNLIITNTLAVWCHKPTGHFPAPISQIQFVFSQNQHEIACTVKESIAVGRPEVKFQSVPSLLLTWNLKMCWSRTVVFTGQRVEFYWFPKLICNIYNTAVPLKCVCVCVCVCIFL